MTSARSTPSIEVDTDAAAEADLDVPGTPVPGTPEPGSFKSTSTDQPRHPAGFGTMLVLGLADLVIDLAVVATAIGVLAAIAGLGGALLGWSLTYLVPWLVLGPILGLLVLALLPWVLRGYGWAERHRAAAVYGIELTGLPRRHTHLRGFRGLLHQWWLDASDSTPWRALGFLALSALRILVLGLLVVAGVGGGIAFLLAPVVRWQADITYFLDLPNWTLSVLGGIALVIGLVTAVGAGYLDRFLARTILGVSEHTAMRRQLELVAAQRTSAVAAASDQRRRIERDIHDDVQPRLVSIAMTLGMAKGRLESDPAQARELIEQAHTESKETLVELRRLVQGFQPSVLADRGLDAALSAVVARSPIPVALDIDLSGGSCSQEAEGVVYFAVSEALTNVAKHARAQRCAVSVARVGDRLVATITDDGIGGAHVGDGTAGGLAGMRERAFAAGGGLRLVSPPGGPTTITVEVPCAS